MNVFEQLAARCEAATAEQQRECLEAAWAVIHGAPPRRNRDGDNPENRFVSMLDARAYESAAMTLVPEIQPLPMLSMTGVIGGQWVAYVRNGSITEVGRSAQEWAGAGVASALALCAAALRARAAL